MSVPTRPVRIAICDYGAGNLHSLEKALSVGDASVRIEADARIAADPSRTDLLVLPGVGGFGAAAERLAPARATIRRVVANGMPILGICLGMQLFFDTSEEGAGQGLGLIEGRVRRLRARRVPQIGWNTLMPDERSIASLRDAPTTVYYANSFVCEPIDARGVLAWSEHEDDRFPALVVGGPASNVAGLQFHPEKSSAPGVRFLRRMVEQLCAGVVS
jgi:glutamine amidotransferase